MRQHKEKFFEQQRQQEGQAGNPQVPLQSQPPRPKRVGKQLVEEAPKSGYFSGRMRGGRFSPANPKQKLINLGLLALALLLILGLAFGAHQLFSWMFSTQGQLSTLPTRNTTAPTSAESLPTTPTSANAPLALPESAAEVMILEQTPILTAEQAAAWASQRGADPLFVELAPLFWQKAEAVGINPLLAYCQSALETDFMHFSGVMTAEAHNPCGLKTLEAKGDAPEDHMHFVSWAQGIQAQMDHLALYAGRSGYPRKDSPDPRQFPFLFSTVHSLADLGGKWAPAEDYGDRIFRLYQEALESAN